MTPDRQAVSTVGRAVAICEAIMRVLIRALILVLFFFIGASWQAKNIQGACEAMSDVTFINGKKFFCIPRKNIRIVPKQESSV
jgi:hypothetical protein